MNGYRFLSSSVWLLSLSICSADPDEALGLFEAAQKHAEMGEIQSAIAMAEKSFEASLEKPSTILSSEAFAGFRNSPKRRDEVRALLKKHTRESEIWMVTKKEPGKRLTVTGKVVDEQTGKPLKGVSLELSQVDHTGNYSTDSKRFNPRLFGFLRTDTDGKFTVHTVRPISYKNDDGELELAHIHFGASRKGYRDFNAEFVFDDDKLMNPKRRKALEADRIPVAQVAKQRIDGAERAEVVIRLQPAR